MKTLKPAVSNSTQPTYATSGSRRRIAAALDRTACGASDDVAASVGGIRASAAGGLAMLSPFTRDGLFSHDNNDYAAIGASWAQAASTPGIADETEFSLEMTFVLQLTATTTIQPDLQLVWNNRANAPDGPEVVFQLQLNITW